VGKLGIALQSRYNRHRQARISATVTAMRARTGPLTSAMKGSHPWTNRTTNAEKSLGAAIDNPLSRGHETIITMRVGYINSPRVPYGIWLELAHAGRFAVVHSAVRREIPKLTAATRTARKGK
jgi:hypothetical protein